MKPTIPQSPEALAAILAGLKPQPSRTRKPKAVPTDRHERMADVLVARMANDRHGVSEVFKDECETFVCRLRSVHRDDVETAEAMEALRAYAASLGVYFESVTRTSKN